MAGADCLALIIALIKALIMALTMALTMALIIDDSIFAAKRNRTIEVKSGN